LHVLTDVWSSVAVLIALGLIKLTGWVWWDPIAASLAAANICRTGFGLIRESLGGLLDASDPAMEKRIRELLEQETQSRGMSYHLLRHRHSGRVHWVEFHLVCDDVLSVGRAHELATEIESRVAALLSPDGRVISHLEPKSTADYDEAWEER
jgi:cation diffusion facilitator family transporter